MRDAWEGEPPTGVPEDFVVIYGPVPGVAWVVSAAEARRVEAALDATPPPRWITWRGLNGSRCRVRTRWIMGFEEDTAAQRAFRRAFNRARTAEKKADGWADGDD